MSETAHRSNLLPALPWALYLGVSWTWCIGMFLPVLLLRDFGPAGFWVFAIPNVVGAAAMGFILRSADQSRAMVQRNALACTAFSIVTILFHLFFAAWILQLLLGGWAGVIVGGWLLLILIVMRFFRAGERTAAIAVYLFSLAAAFVIWQRGNLVPIPAPPHVPPANLLGLALVCLLGFALCPYLDLTFHRARQETAPVPARLAFTLGFGGFFFSMILFTVAYAGILLPLLVPRLAIHSNATRFAQTMVALHIAVQSAFTIAAHGTEMRQTAGRFSWLALLILLPIPITFGILALPGQLWLNLDRGELIYRLFLSFYGLLFPAYVWICGHRIPRLANWLGFTIAVLAAAPFYYLGFIKGQHAWVIPGVVIIFIAGIIPRLTRPGSPQPTPGPAAHRS